MRLRALPFLLMTAPAALASGPYPADLQRHLDASAAPACNLCHQSPQGGDTVVTPFGVAMKDQGLTGFGQTELLTAALDALEAEGTDSDGDGTGDIDELRAGRDPNVDDGDGGGGGGGDVPPPPGYGFGCATAPAASSLVGLVVALGLAARRRRR
jgi:MYXO-CTERM domain-containing protein